MVSKALRFILPPSAVVLDSAAESPVVAEIRRRFGFYLPGWRLKSWNVDDGRGLSPVALLLARWCRAPIVYAGREDMRRAPQLLRGNPCYWLNPRTNCREAWEWHDLASQNSHPRVDIVASRSRLWRYAEQKGLDRLGRAYVFGTGPSLARAGEREWGDGVRLVCNTIVRDRELWGWLQPHFILAADAGYHFSMTRHAAAFRADLRARLKETDTLFLYPAPFDVVVRRELAGLEDRLVPIPDGARRDIMYDLRSEFALPDLHNILPRLLLVAGTFANDVQLWGFDGRAPEATDFWQNSGRQSYPEYMAELKTAYPAFFEELVPEKDPTKYIRRAFGDELEGCLASAEAAGKHYTMLHETYTETLRRRRPGYVSEVTRA